MSWSLPCTTLYLRCYTASKGRNDHIEINDPNSLRIWDKICQDPMVKLNDKEKPQALRT